MYPNFGKTACVRFGAKLVSCESGISQHLRLVLEDRADMNLGQGRDSVFFTIFFFFKDIDGVSQGEEKTAILNRTNKFQNILLEGQKC